MTYGFWLLTSNASLLYFQLCEAIVMLNEVKQLGAHHCDPMEGVKLRST